MILHGNDFPFNDSIIGGFEPETLKDSIIIEFLNEHINELEISDLDVLKERIESRRRG